MPREQESNNVKHTHIPRHTDTTIPMEDFFSLTDYKHTSKSRLLGASGRQRRNASGTWDTRDYTKRRRIVSPY